MSSNVKSPGKTHRPLKQEEEDTDANQDVTGEDEWLNVDDAHHDSHEPHHDWKMDCGNRHFKFLSYEHAVHNVNLRHPRLRNHLENEYSNRAYRFWPLSKWLLDLCRITQ
jgi:hypothetical protein